MIIESYSDNLQRKMKHYTVKARESCQSNNSDVIHLVRATRSLSDRYVRNHNNYT